MKGEALYTATELAVEVGVAPATIYVWRSRKFIEPVGKRGRFLLYRLEDGFEAERSRQRQFRRKGSR